MVYVNRDVIFHDKFFPFAKVIPQLDSSVVVHGSPLETIGSLGVGDEFDNEDDGEPEVTITDNEDN